MLDSYSLAYSISTLINQLFGKSRDPFWQQAYTNLVRWIVELYRLLPGAVDYAAGRLPLHHRCRSVCQQDSGGAAAGGQGLPEVRVTIACKDLFAHKDPLTRLELADRHGRQPSHLCPQSRPAGSPGRARAFQPRRSGSKEAPGSELREQVEAIERWYRNDWVALDAKIRTTIVEGVSVFLSLFDQPKVGGVFCPPPPSPGEAASSRPVKKDAREEDSPETPAAPSMPGLRRRLPPLAELIESGKVLALNMPAGANPALARAVGVLLKNAWMQALLRRPAEIERRPDRYCRPAVFICDEYQAFASVGEDDPSGDEKAFALTRQCRCIPIVATQSISSLRSVLPGSEAWRTLIQTLRTRIFLSLSDEASARIASELCGSVLKMKPSYTFTENTSRPEVSLLSARAGGGRGSIGASKSFRQVREPVFSPRDFSLLSNYQAICLPYDGTQSLPARRVYLKPHYLPREHGYWRLREEGRI